MTNVTQTTTQPMRYGFAKRHGVLLQDINKQTATICYHQLPQSTILLELQRHLACHLQLEQVSADEFNTRLTQTYEGDSNTAMQMVDVMGEELDLDQLVNDLPKTEDLLETQDDAPVIRLLNALLSQAIKRKASDIHLETFEQRVVVRFRIDGVLCEILEIQRVLAPLIVSRIKVMAKLDIAEKRLPQDGRISLRIAGHSVDLRVSTIPASHGERVVLRLLDKKAAKLDLNLLGMAPQTLDATQHLIQKPNGIILVTGPTGSGKTTSLYAMLTQLNDVSRNILTVEDPIEYDLPGIGQTQVNDKIDMSFAKGLRSMLRQDPDVVMVGEIRDLETAQVAVQASLTGHVVLSTLHTNSAAGAITRLRDMGVESFLLASSLIGVIAQRLVRLLCPECKQGHLATPAELELLQFGPHEKITLYTAQGCPHCNQSGYVGRTGIYEIVQIDNPLQNMIHENQSEHAMQTYARKQLPSMRQDGFRRACKGETTLEEVLRVTSED